MLLEELLVLLLLTFDGHLGILVAFQSILGLLEVMDVMRKVSSRPR
jgi:hypothetical protein